MPDGERDLGVQVAGSSAGAPRHQGVVASSVIGNGTLSDQAVVVTLDGVFHDGGEGGGLIGALAELLNSGHQFHRVLTQADAELLRSIGMVVCHCCWDEWNECGREFRPHQQGSGHAFDEPLWVSGSGLRGADFFESLDPQRNNYSIRRQEWCA